MSYNQPNMWQNNQFYSQQQMGYSNPQYPMQPNGLNQQNVSGSSQFPMQNSAQQNLPQNNIANFNQGQAGIQYRAEDLQPYNNQQFLCKTFNYKVQYIQAFLALPADIKLKFYLSLQEAKLYGEMKDKEGYKYILQRIAVAAKILQGKPFGNEENQMLQPKKTMEQKINELCDYQFAKLHVNDHEGGIKDQDLNDFQSYTGSTSISSHANQGIFGFQQDKKENKGPKNIMQGDWLSNVNSMADNMGLGVKAVKQEPPTKIESNQQDEEFGDFNDTVNNNIQEQGNNNQSKQDQQNWQWSDQKETGEKHMNNNNSNDNANKQISTNQMQSMTSSNLLDDDENIVSNNNSNNFGQIQSSKNPTFDQICPSTSPRLKDPFQIERPKFKWMEKLEEDQTYKEDIFNLNIDDEENIERKKSQKDKQNATSMNLIGGKSVNQNHNPQLQVCNNNSNLPQTKNQNDEEEQFEEFTEAETSENPNTKQTEDKVQSFKQKVQQNQSKQTVNFPNSFSGDNIGISLDGLTFQNNEGGSNTFSIDQIYKQSQITSSEKPDESSSIQGQIHAEQNEIKSTEFDILDSSNKTSESSNQVKIDSLKVDDIDLMWGSNGTVSQQSQFPDLKNFKKDKGSISEAKDGQLIDFGSDLIEVASQSKPIENAVQTESFVDVVPSNQNNLQKPEMEIQKQPEQDQEQWEEAVQSRQNEPVSQADSINKNYEPSINISIGQNFTESNVSEQVKPESMANNIKTPKINEYQDQEWGRYEESEKAEKNQADLSRSEVVNSPKINIEYDRDPSMSIDTDRESSDQGDNNNIMLSSSHQNYVEHEASRMSTPRSTTYANQRDNDFQMNQTTMIHPGTTFKGLVKKQVPAVPEEHHPLLKPLLIPETSTPYIKNMVSQIKNNSFQCNAQFYGNVMEWLKALSFQKTEAFKHAESQLETVEKIKELTQLYAKAVEQDQEEKVQSALKQSKKYYKYLNPEKTKKLLQFYIKRGNRTLLYDLAEFIIESGVSIQFVEKLLPTKSGENFPFILIALYLMQKNNSMQSIPVYSTKLNTYVLRQYEKYRQNLDKMKSSLSYEDQEEIFKTEKYSKYIEGLGTIGILCRRMCSLMKISSKSSGSLVKVLKICKQLQNAASEHLLERENRTLKNLWESEANEKLVCQKYYDFIIESLYQHTPVSDLKNKMNDFTQSVPLCRLCLGGQSLNQKQGVKIHTECWNLYRTVAQEIQD